MELRSENDSNALNMAAMGFRERTRSRSFAAAETPFDASEMLGSNPLRRHSSFSLEALPVEILDVEVVNVGSPAKEKSRFMDRMKTNFGKLIGKKGAPVGPAPISRHATKKAHRGEKKKAKEEMKARNRSLSPIPIACFNDLDETIKKEVRHAKIKGELIEDKQDLTTLLNCIHFLLKLSFIYTYEPGQPPILIGAKARKAGARGSPTSTDDEEAPSELPTSESGVAGGAGGVEKEEKARKKPKSGSNPPPIGDLVSDGVVKKELKVEKEVGHGGYGRVYSARNLQKGQKGKVAVKKMQHTEKKQKKTNEKEVHFLSIMDHPNIVKYYYSYLVENEIWAIMEFMEGGTLTEAIKGHGAFHEKQAAYVAQEMLKGISYLHKLGFVHRDLKSANVMMTIHGDVKLIDFGLCITETDLCADNYHMCGSPYWMPPEMIRRQPYDRAVDLWSFGICILELANGKPPHRSSALRAMYTAGTVGYPQPFRKPDGVTPLFKDFMGKCLDPLPALRASAEDLLSHSFLKKADTKKGMKRLLSSIFLQESMKQFNL